MESFWSKAKTLAEEALQKSQTLTQTLPTSSSKIADIVSETAKRSKDLAAEASKRASEKAEELRSAALSLADQIPKNLAISTSSLNEEKSDLVSDEVELERLGVTDDLRDFVKGLTASTFQNFPVQDDVPTSDVATVSNVRQDLSEWQQKHANLVLTTVKEISKLRYELCPRHMQDRRFWRIYFTLVSTHVSPYERRFNEEKLKQAEERKDDKVEKSLVAGPEGKGGSLKTKTSSAEQDLDTFLLGDLDDADGQPDDNDLDDDNFDDDFDKIDNSEIEEGK